MDLKQLESIFDDTAYIRTGGSKEELKCAQYDSVALSQGAYDNMSGSVGILAVAEYFSKHPHRYGFGYDWLYHGEIDCLLYNRGKISILFRIIVMIQRKL